MKVLKILLMCTVLLSYSTAYGQEKSYTLTLQQAREYALKNNKMLINARAGVASSQQKVKETIAQGLPQVEGSLSYLTYFNYEMDLGFGSSNETPDINYALLDLGDLEVLNALGQMFGSSEPIVMKDQVSGKLQLSQLIFSGQYLAGIKTAKIARKLADQSVAASEQDIKENVTNTYCQILISERTLKVIDENIKNLNEILQHTTNMYHAGLAEETDVDQLKITVNQIKNSQKALERMNQLNRNMLKFQLGVPPETTITLADSLPQILNAVSPQSALANEFNINDNINYQMMESQVQLSKKQVDLRKWAYAPTIAGYYNYTGKILKTDFDLNPSHLAGVTMNVPIWSSGVRKAQLAQSKISCDMAQRNLEIVRDQLELQKTQLVFVYQNALENYETQKENVSVAGRVYKSIQNKYEHGAASSLDLTQANSNYLTAESNYYSAVMTLIQAQTSLDKLFNKL
ncbi:MAG TPA: TolC family protein [Bacteroidales bacterium]|nr:TolC family protein [Bacteroidales bacterium]